jgi:hypothetical protein
MAIRRRRLSLPAALNCLHVFRFPTPRENAAPLSLVHNVVWLDRQARPTNDVPIDYFLWQDIEVHVNLHEEPAYQKVLP